ncbi:hypothetical protein HDU76_004470 [Blyttiomyces sp. JEL0837]|nr:hypothetical protein HDU76_004470 [Blyttiomyces sp. JEL0837]
MRSRTRSHENPFRTSQSPGGIPSQARRQSMGGAEAQITKDIDSLQASKEDGSSTGSPRLRAMIMILTEDDLKHTSGKRLLSHIGMDSKLRAHSITYITPSSTPTLPKSSSSSSNGRDRSLSKTRSQLSVTDTTSNGSTRVTPPHSKICLGGNLSESIEDYTKKSEFATLRSESAKRWKTSLSAAPTTIEVQESQGNNQLDRICVQDVEPRNRQPKNVKQTGWSGLMKWIRGGMKPKNHRWDIIAFS